MNTKRPWRARVYYTSSIYGNNNWYVGYFRWLWLAYIMVRIMAYICDITTPTKIRVKDGIRTAHGYKDDIQEYPFGINWAVERIWK